MGILVEKHEEIRSVSGNCYVGMTVKDAAEAGKSIFKEFTKLNTDYNDCLSYNEIITSRNKAVNLKATTAKILGIFGIMNCFSGITLEKLPEKYVTDLCNISGKSFAYHKWTTLAETLLLAGIAIYEMAQAVKINKETDNMIKNH